MEWINVKDRLPEGESPWVLAFVPNIHQSYDAITAAEYDGENWYDLMDTDWDGGWPKLNGVTHWMPRPDPPN